jgi:cell division protein FtsB
MLGRRQVLWASVVIALVLAGGSAFAEGGFRRYFKLTREVASLKDKNERLAADNARLRREVEGLKGDDAALERAAREELGVVRPGELVFLLESP